MKQKQKEDYNSQKKLFRLIKISIFFLIIVFVIEIWVVNRLSTYGQRIQDIKQTQTNLILENQILENSIAQNMSLHIIEQRAGMLGFSSAVALTW